MTIEFEELEARIRALIRGNPFYQDDDSIDIDADFDTSSNITDLTVTYFVKRMSLIGLNDQVIDTQNIPADLARDSSTGFYFKYVISETRGELEKGLVDALVINALERSLGEGGVPAGPKKAHRMTGEVAGWLHVLPEYRQRGVGRELANLVIEVGRIVSFDCMFYKPEPTDNRNFLRRIGFKPFEGHYLYKVL